MIFSVLHELRPETDLVDHHHEAGSRVAPTDVTTAQHASSLCTGSFRLLLRTARAHAREALSPLTISALTMSPLRDTTLDLRPVTPRHDAIPTEDERETRARTVCSGRSGYVARTPS